MNKKQMLRSARELFASTHWTQGTMMDKGRRKTVFCAIGGLRYTAFGDAHAYGFDASDLSGIAYRQSLHDLVSIIAMNDNPQSSSAEYAMENFDADLFSRDDDERQHAVTVFEDAVIEWNDDDRTVLDDILKAFDTALARA